MLIDTDAVGVNEPVVETVTEFVGETVVVVKFEDDTVAVADPDVLTETDVVNEFDPDGETDVVMEVLPVADEDA